MLFLVGVESAISSFENAITVLHYCRLDLRLSLGWWSFLSVVAETIELPGFCSLFHDVKCSLVCGGDTKIVADIHLKRDMILIKCTELRSGGFFDCSESFLNGYCATALLRCILCVASV